MDIYHTLFRNFLEPVFEGIFKKRDTIKIAKALENSSSWSLEKLEAFQLKELKRLLQHAETQVPYWRKVFEEVGFSPDSISSVEDLRKLPLLTKEIINQQNDRCIAENYRGKTWSKTTGGSTGIPLSFHYTPHSYDWRVATTRRGYSWAGCYNGKKQLHIWGVVLGKQSKITRLKEKVHQLIFKQKYLNCFDWGENIMEDALNKLASFKPETIIAYTNPLYEWARFCKRRDVIPFSPKSIITGAEKLHPFQRELISEVFRCPVFNTYGSREFMLMASECDQHNGLHVHMENILIEILHPNGSPAEPGEIGDIVVTDLHNYGMPFIRYKIGDMGMWAKEPCSCGCAHPLLKDIVGRSLDMLYGVDGRRVPGEFFPHMLKDFPIIRQFQVVQKKRDQLLIKLILCDRQSNWGQSEVEREIKQIMGEGMKCKFEIVDEIPLTRTGKFRVTLSEISEEPVLM